MLPLARRRVASGAFAAASLLCGLCRGAWIPGCRDSVSPEEAAAGAAVPVGWHRASRTQRLRHDGCKLLFAPRLRSMSTAGPTSSQAGRTSSSQRGLGRPTCTETCMCSCSPVLVHATARHMPGALACPPTMHPNPGPAGPTPKPLPLKAFRAGGHWHRGHRSVRVHWHRQCTQ